MTKASVHKITSQALLSAINASPNGFKNLKKCSWFGWSINITTFAGLILSMKRINEYKKLFGIDKPIVLTELKQSYRILVKQWHPDKFQDGDPLKAEAEEMGRRVVDGYHFLVSIAPETKAANLEDYNRTINECGIADFRHKGLLLEITFTDGSCYEYFGVNANVYKKLINADKQVRFAKRFIYESFLYRQSKKASAVEA